MRNYIGISRDRRVNDAVITPAAGQDYSNIIASIKENAVKHHIETMVSIAKADISSGIPGYVSLSNSIRDLINQVKLNADASVDTDVACFILCIVNNDEIPFHKFNQFTLGPEIVELQHTGRWSFIFRVPVGYKDSLVCHGIPAGNILEYDWDETTDLLTINAFTKMFIERAANKTAFDHFYN